MSSPGLQGEADKHQHLHLQGLQDGSMLAAQACRRPQVPRALSSNLCSSKGSRCVTAADCSICARAQLLKLSVSCIARWCISWLLWFLSRCKKVKAPSPRLTMAAVSVAPALHHRAEKLCVCSSISCLHSSCCSRPQLRCQGEQYGCRLQDVSNSSSTNCQD